MNTVTVQDMKNGIEELDAIREIVAQVQIDIINLNKKIGRATASEEIFERATDGLRVADYLLRIVSGTVETVTNIWE